MNLSCMIRDQVQIHGIYKCIWTWPLIIQDLSKQSMPRSIHCKITRYFDFYGYNFLIVISFSIMYEESGPTSHIDENKKKMFKNGLVWVSHFFFEVNHLKPTPLIEFFIKLIFATMATNWNFNCIHAFV